MDRLTENKVVLVTRRTRLDDLVARFNTASQAKFYVEHMGADFSDYLHEHERYRSSVGACVATLERIGRLHVLDRSFLPNFIFGNDDSQSNFARFVLELIQSLYIGRDLQHVVLDFGGQTHF